MILVSGTVTARPDAFDQALAESLAHVRRSRAEPGCLSHEVAVDAENPHRLVFVERWADLAALRVHFAVPATREFGKVLRSVSAAPGTLHIYEAVETTP
jgi:quinol monooxygenase YgiN